MAREVIGVFFKKFDECYRKELSKTDSEGFVVKMRNYCGFSHRVFKGILKQATDRIAEVYSRIFDWETAAKVYEKHIKKTRMPKELLWKLG